MCEKLAGVDGGEARVGLSMPGPGADWGPIAKRCQVRRLFGWPGPGFPPRRPARS